MAEKIIAPIDNVPLKTETGETKPHKYGSETKGDDLERQTTNSEEFTGLEVAEDLQITTSHISTAEIATVDPYKEQGDEIYNKFSNHRKHIMTFVLSFCGFLAPISSTTVLSAIPEVAQTYRTTGSIINISNALYLVFMGISRKYRAKFLHSALIIMIKPYSGVQSGRYTVDVGYVYKPDGSIC